MRGSISPFNYIVKRTFLRPREVLQFLEECINQAGQQETVIMKNDVRAAEERYSGWKVSDLKQEYAKVFPHFDTLLECFRQEVHRYDRLADLEVLLRRKVPQLVEDNGVRNLMETLFECSPTKRRRRCSSRGDVTAESRQRSNSTTCCSAS